MTRLRGRQLRLSYVCSDHRLAVFVDGNHKYGVALSDHRLADEAGARYIAHHDIVSQACDTRILWPRLVANDSHALAKHAHPSTASGSAAAGLAAASYARRFRAHEFVQQYRSVRGTFLGIGVLTRLGRRSHGHAREDSATVAGRV